VQPTHRSRAQRPCIIGQMDMLRIIFSIGQNGRRSTNLPHIPACDGLGIRPHNQERKKKDQRPNISSKKGITQVVFSAVVTSLREALYPGQKEGKLATIMLTQLRKLMRSFRRSRCHQIHEFTPHTIKAFVVMLS
jgi:hypothetical protein